MLLLNEREYGKAVEAKNRAAGIIERPESSNLEPDLFIAARRRQQPVDGLGLNFPWGSQLFLVWDR